MRVKPSNLVDVAAQFGSTIVGRGAYVLLQIVLARVLGPYGFGLYAIGWTVIGLASTLAPVGMPQATLRFGVGGRPALAAPPMRVALLVGLAGAAILWAGADLLATDVFTEPAAAPVIRGFAPALPLLGIFAVMLAALRVSHAMLAAAAVGAALFILYLALTLLAFQVGPSPALAADAYGVSVALAIIPSALLLWSSASACSVPPIGPLLRFGVVTMLIHSANVLNLWADRVVIGIMADPETLAMYQIASQLAMIVVVLRSAVTTIFEAAVPKPEANARPPDITREFMQAYRLLLHVSGPGIVVLAMTAGTWVRLLFGPAYIHAAAPLAVLAAGQLVITLTGPSVPALHMTGEERRVMRLTLGTCALNVVGNVALIPLIGAVGAALATLVANAIVGAACFSRLVRTGRVRFSANWFRDIILALAACAGLSVAVSGLVGTLSAYSAVALLAGAYVLYVLILCTICTAEDELVQLARSVLRRALRRPVST